MGLYSYLFRERSKLLSGQDAGLAAALVLGTAVFGFGFLAVVIALAAAVLILEGMIALCRKVSRARANRPPRPPRVVYVPRELPPLTKDDLYRAAVENSEKNHALIDASPLPPDEKKALHDEETQALTNMLRNILDQA